MGSKINAEQALSLGSAFTPIFMSQIPQWSSQYAALAGQQDALGAGLQAEAIKKAAKKKKKTGWGQIAGTAAAIGAAPFTGGASLAYLPMASAGGAAIDSAINGDTQGAIANAGQAATGYFGAQAQMPVIDIKAAPSTPIDDITTGGQLLGPYSNSVGGEFNFGEAAAKAAPSAQAAPQMVNNTLQLSSTGTPTQPNMPPLVPTDMPNSMLNPNQWPAGGVDKNFNTTAALATAGGAGLAMLGQQRRQDEENKIAQGARAAGKEKGPTTPNAMHPSQQGAINVIADTKPGEWRRIWRENPLQGYTMVQSLADKGVKLSREQVRAMPHRYRQMLRKQGVDVPEAGFERIDQFVLPLTAGLAAGYLLKNDDGIEDFVANF